MQAVAVIVPPFIIHLHPIVFTLEPAKKFTQAQKNASTATLPALPFCGPCDPIMILAVYSRILTKRSYSIKVRKADNVFDHLFLICQIEM